MMLLLVVGHPERSAALSELSEDVWRGATAATFFFIPKVHLMAIIILRVFLTRHLRGQRA